VGVRGNVGDAEPSLLTGGGSGVQGLLCAFWASSGLRGYLTGPAYGERWLASFGDTPTRSFWASLLRWKPTETSSTANGGRQGPD
jgi:hypothetical protein